MRRRQRTQNVHSTNTSELLMSASVEGNRPSSMIHLEDLEAGTGMQQARDLVRSESSRSLSQEEKMATFKEIYDQVQPTETALIAYALLTYVANGFYASEDYDGAIKQYNLAAAYALGSDEETYARFSLPSYSVPKEDLKIYNDVCQNGDMLTIRRFLYMIYSFCNLGICCIKLGDYIKAIDWLQEAQNLYKYREEHNSRNGYPWIQPSVVVREFWTYVLRCRLRLSGAFYDLGNSGTAAYYSWYCAMYSSTVLSEADGAKVFPETSRHKELINSRHPNFQTTHKADITHPELQMRGSWKKLRTRYGYKPRNRAGFASWIWKSKLYVYGGTSSRNITRRLSDIWCLDLQKMHSWRRLPGYPEDLPSHPMCTSDIKMCLWKDNAWLFYGSRKLLKFDLSQDKWFAVDTRWESKEPWPYSHSFASQYCAEVFEGNLHIFGGLGSLISKGTNLHMSLNLQTLCWKKLGGTVDSAKLIKGMPTMRRWAGSWVVSRLRRMYILNGFAARQEMKPDDCTPDHQYEDMWSYSFDENEWTRERFRGNFPAPRNGMACVYDQGTDNVIVFGGCNCHLPIIDLDPEDGATEDQQCFTHFGDTFVCDMETHIWKQVLTRNFPYYRAFGNATVDDDTGNIYLFGANYGSSYIGVQPSVVP